MLAFRHLSFGLLALVGLAGCGEDGHEVHATAATPPSVSVATVALPALTLDPPTGSNFCAPSLSVSLYVQGPQVRGALVETLSVPGCTELNRHPRFYEFRRTLYACGTLTHIGRLAGAKDASLTLIDRSASKCEQQDDISEIEIEEHLPSGQRIRVTGSF